MSGVMSTSYKRALENYGARTSLRQDHDKWAGELADIKHVGNTCTFADTGLKSAIMAMIMAVPEILSSFVVNKKMLLGNGDNKYTIRGTDIEKQLANIATVNDVATLAMLMVYKNLEVHADLLSSDKEVHDTRYPVIDMTLIYFDVGVDFDGHMLGNEDNVVAKRVEHDGNQWKIISPKVGLITNRSVYRAYNDVKLSQLFEYYSPKYYESRRARIYMNDVFYWTDIIKSGITFESTTKSLFTTVKNRAVYKRKKEIEAKVKAQKEALQALMSKAVDA